MYWNFRGCCRFCLRFRLTLTWDVLKPKNWAAESETGSRINFNMGCIETIFRVLCLYKVLYRLTLTWDVLKLFLLSCSLFVAIMINFNMGCIETYPIRLMPCIQMRLTLTWDVLKPGHKKWYYRRLQINFNMGCIETSFLSRLSIAHGD